MGAFTNVEGTRNRRVHISSYEWKCRNHALLIDYKEN